MSWRIHLSCLYFESIMIFKMYSSTCPKSGTCWFFFMKLFLNSGCYFLNISKLWSLLHSMVFASACYLWKGRNNEKSSVWDIRWSQSLYCNFLSKLQLIFSSYFIELLLSSAIIKFPLLNVKFTYKKKGRWYYDDFFGNISDKWRTEIILLQFKIRRFFVRIAE